VFLEDKGRGPVVARDGERPPAHGTLDEALGGVVANQDDLQAVEGDTMPDTP
jgi:hypothetical protein